MLGSRRRLYTSDGLNEYLRRLMRGYCKDLAGLITKIIKNFITAV